MKSYIERRQQMRSAISVEATLVAEGGLSRRRTVIVHLSQSGAMIEIAGTEEVPAHVTLLFARRLQPCTVVWRDQRYIGLSFSAGER